MSPRMGAAAHGLLFGRLSHALAGAAGPACSDATNEPAAAATVANDLEVNTLGVCYDAGVVMGVPWRPTLDARTARREMEIIRREIHYTAVRIVARDVRRLELAKRQPSPNLDRAFAKWCFMLECDSPGRWAAASSETAGCQ